MKHHALRLLPGQDLKKEIAQLCKDRDIRAAYVGSSVGSVKHLVLRLAYSNTFFEKQDYFEILSLNGTVSTGGIHLHMAVAGSDGSCIGGHLLDGNIIYTTCELVLVELTEFEFQREQDQSTGFKELKIKTTLS